MEIAEIRSLLEDIDERLDSENIVLFDRFIRNDTAIDLYLTSYLKRNLKKGRRWKSKEFCQTLKNAEYGFDTNTAMSRGGKDGIFLITREFKPKNPMMEKVFDRFIDKAESGVEIVLARFGVRRENLKAVRLVSHHMRLLGLSIKTPTGQAVVLIDYDQSGKRS